MEMVRCEISVTGVAGMRLDVDERRRGPVGKMLEGCYTLYPRDILTRSSTSWSY